MYYSGGLFITPLIVTFDIGKGRAASYIAIYSTIALVFSFLFGCLQDLLAARGYTSRPIFLVGSFLIYVGTYGASYCESFGTFLCCTIITGVGMGFTCFSAPSVMSLWFQKSKGQYLMFAMSGSGIGISVYANAIVLMLREFHDEGTEKCQIGVDDPNACSEWRLTLRCMGLFSSIILLVASLFMREPEPKEVEYYENHQNTQKKRERFEKREEDEIGGTFFSLDLSHMLNELQDQERDRRSTGKLLIERIQSPSSKENFRHDPLEALEGQSSHVISGVHVPIRRSSLFSIKSANSVRNLGGTPEHIEMRDAQFQLQLQEKLAQLEGDVVQVSDEQNSLEQSINKPQNQKEECQEVTEKEKDSSEEVKVILKAKRVDSCRLTEEVHSRDSLVETLRNRMTLLKDDIIKIGILQRVQRNYISEELRQVDEDIQVTLENRQMPQIDASAECLTTSHDCKWVTDEASQASEPSYTTSSVFVGRRQSRLSMSSFNFSRNRISILQDGLIDVALQQRDSFEKALDQANNDIQEMIECQTMPTESSYASVSIGRRRSSILSLRSFTSSKLPDTLIKKVDTLSQENGDLLLFKDAILTKTSLLLCLWALIMALVIDAFFFFAPIYAEEVGLSIEEGALTLSVAGLSLLLGNLTIGCLTDRLGNILVFQLCIAGLTCTMIAWPFCRSLWSLLIASFFVGFFTVCISLFVSILADVYGGGVSKNSFFEIVGFVQALEAPGVLVGPVVIGVLIDDFGFNIAAFFCAGVLALSLILILLLPSKQKQLQIIYSI